MSMENMSAKSRLAPVKRRDISNMSFAEKILMGVIYTTVILLVLLIVLPCLNILALSFNDGADASRGGITFFPRELTAANYAEVFANGDIVNAYKITVARTIIGTVLSLLITSLAAYALRDRTLPGRRGIIIVITFCLVFSGGTVPTYITFRNLGLLNTFWVYIVPSLVSVTYLMMMRANFESLPDELFESATLDGAGHFRTYGLIVLPLSKAVFAVIGLYTAVGHWNDWFSGAYYMRNSDLWPVQTVLQQMLTRATKNQQEVTNISQAIARQNMVTSDSLQMAAVVITVVPILCVYPFVQKYFAKGSMLGAVKG